MTIRPSARIDLLEPRRLLAAIALSGTAGGDSALFSLQAGLLRITNAGGSTLVINGASTIAPGKSKSYGDVSAISADVGGGNDNVEIAADVLIRATLAGGNGNDTLRGGGERDLIAGGAGDDLLLGGRGRDTLNGNAGRDLLRGGSSNDQLIGDDPAAVEGASDTLYGDDGNDYLFGGAGGDGLYGDDADADRTEDGDDTLVGGDGIDYLNGNGGRDSMSGGDGDDFFTNFDSTQDTIDGGSGNDRRDRDLPDDIEMNVEADYNISITIQIVPDYSLIAGTDGDDTITLSQDYNVLVYTINGTEQRITGPELIERSVYGDNNAELVLIAGDGNDLISILTPIALPAVEITGVLVFGEDGNDTLTDFAGGNTLAGGRGADSISLRAGAGELVGGSGDDVLTGSSRANIISGDFYDDYSGRNALGGEGFLLGSAGVDLITGAGGDDTLRGDAGDDTLFGEGGSDRLFGGNGNDQLYGGSGKDTLYGDAGADTLDGAGDNDRFFAADNQQDHIDGGSGRSDRADVDDLLDGLETVEIVTRS